MAVAVRVASLSHIKSCPPSILVRHSYGEKEKNELHPSFKLVVRLVPPKGSSDMATYTNGGKLKVIDSYWTAGNCQQRICQLLFHFVPFWDALSEGEEQNNNSRGDKIILGHNSITMPADRTTVSLVGVPLRISEIPLDGNGNFGFNKKSFEFNKIVKLSRNQPSQCGNILEIIFRRTIDSIIVDFVRTGVLELQL